jgi:glycopeptide antibiotics resistance protein
MRTEKSLSECYSRRNLIPQGDSGGRSVCEDHHMPDTATGPMRSRALVSVLFAVYAALLVGVILFKFPFQYQLLNSGRELNLIPFAGSFSNPRLGVGEVIENALIFIPFGIYLSMLTSRWSIRRRILAIALTSVVFETIQFAFAIGRADITDVLGNTLGGAIGIGIYALAAKILKNRTHRVLTIAGLVVTILALAFFAFLRAHSR